MKDTEKVTEAMLATVVSACEKYRMIEVEEQKAQAELHKHAKSENEAIYPKEKAMYEKLAADTSTRCLMAYQWRRDFNIALQKVEPFKARMVLEQHFIRGQPLKAIEIGCGKTMSRTTATHYKKVGIRGFARELEKILPDLESKEKIILGK